MTVRVENQSAGKAPPWTLVVTSDERTIEASLVMPVVNGEVRPRVTCAKGLSDEERTAIAEFTKSQWPTTPVREPEFIKDLL
jgi:hypothetical protein